MATESCVGNSVQRSDQYVSMDSRLKVRTRVKLLEVDIDADCVCYAKEPKAVSKRPLHVVFLVDTSDSFNKLELSSSSAGEIILEKFVGRFLSEGNFRYRRHATSATVVQFSGIGPDSSYEPGSNGNVKNTNLFHYKVEVGPVNMKELSDNQRRVEIQKLSDAETIDGNGQIFLALQDISMKNFQDKLERAVPGDSDKVLVIVTDDEWDFGNLKLCSEIVEQKGTVELARKREHITEFAKSVYEEIHTCIVYDGDSPNKTRVDKIEGKFGPHIYHLPRNEISALKSGGNAKTLSSVMEKIMNKVGANFAVEFTKH